MTMTEEQKDQAETAALEVLLDTFGSLELTEFPLDLNAILERYALTLRKGPFDDPDISGAFSRKAHTIYLSDKESPERQAFTVAHEIGHYKLHEDRPIDILYRKQVWQLNSSADTDEAQANWFAANLLMPKEAVERMWNITHDVTRLSQIFGVSVTAMSRRLKDLNLVKG